MDGNKPSGTLPTELIDEKTFYTLGGASAAVLLICWVINNVMAEVSWLDYKVYRLIGLILSEAFAIIIMFQKKDRNMMKWLFAFLNGLLIFVNASGLNIMTSSYIFNPNDSANTKKQSGYFHFQQFRADPYQQAGIFPLPGMINWWPDENLIARNVQLTEKNSKLKSENNHLKTFLMGTANKILPVTAQLDSLGLLKSRIINKQLQIDELEASLKKNGNELQQQLSSCLKERTAINDSMKTYLQKYLSCRQSYGSLSEDYNRLQKNQGDCDYQIKLLNRKLDVCTSEKSSLQGKLDALNAKIAELTQQVKNTEGQSTLNQATLVDLFRQICEKNIPMHKIPTHTIYQKTDDDLLKEQGFYKDINWAVFCRNFNSWYAVKDIK